MKKKKHIVIIGGIILVVLAGVVMLFGKNSHDLPLENSPLPFSRLEIELSDSGELAFSAEIKKGELLVFLEKETPKLYAVVDIASRLLPEAMDISGKVACIKAEDEKRIFKFRSLSLGGYKIPEKLLIGMGEFHLDFERSLVYNE